MPLLRGNGWGADQMRVRELGLELGLGLGLGSGVRGGARGGGRAGLLHSVHEWPVDPYKAALDTMRQ